MKINTVSECQKAPHHPLSVMTSKYPKEKSLGLVAGKYTHIHVWFWLKYKLLKCSVQSKTRINCSGPQTETQNKGGKKYPPRTLRILYALARQWSNNSSDFGDICLSTVSPVKWLRGNEAFQWCSVGPSRAVPVPPSQRRHSAMLQKW